jgi:hypothetical protein
MGSVSDGIPCRAPVLSRRTPAGDTHPRDRSANACGYCITLQEGSLRNLMRELLQRLPTG